MGIVASVLGIAGCARHGNEGEACSAPGISGSEYGGAYSGEYGGDCAAGLICTADRSTTPEYTGFATATCRTECYGPQDCEMGTICRGVSGADTHRACFPVD